MSSSYLPPSYMLPNHAHSLRPYDPSFPPPSPFLPIQSCHPPQKIQPPAGLQQDPLQTDQFYADLFTDTGSVYQPSEWDLPTVKVPPPPSITTEPEVNYEDFLKTIFEVEEEDSPRQPSHLQNQVQEELEESEMIPKVSLMGAYDCNSSDNDEKAFKSPEKKKSPGKKTSPAKFVSPRKRTSPTKRSPVKRASFEVNPIDSFFNFYNGESFYTHL